VLFQARFKAALRAGTLSLTYRYWRAPRVRCGAVYRIAPDLAIRVTSIEIAGAITADDALRAGFETVAALRSYLTRQERGEGRSLYRIEFERVAVPNDPRAELAQQPVDTTTQSDLRKRLAAMDARSAVGPWTLTVLRMIGATPGKRAADLAAQMNWETLQFKAHVRRLKALGLTESLEVGYRLSPRGCSLLDIKPR
jgi:hypothetical protein